MRHFDKQIDMTKPNSTDAHDLHCLIDDALDILREYQDLERKQLTGGRDLRPRQAVCISQVTQCADSIYTALTGLQVQVARETLTVHSPKEYYAPEETTQEDAESWRQRYGAAIQMLENMSRTIDRLSAHL